MSRLLVVTHPTLINGYHLAGVEAYGATSTEAAQKTIAGWLEAGESGLLVVDEALVAGFSAAFRRRLEAAAHLPYVALPAGEVAGGPGAMHQEITDLIRRTVGFHITFHGEQS